MTKGLRNHSPQNLASQLEGYLPRHILELLQDASLKANRLGEEVYIVGGVVRDLFLYRTKLIDLDLVVEGDAIRLAQELARNSSAKLKVHPRFGTANLVYPDFSLDFATTRRETYVKPGALPSVSPGTISDDLSRRDFSINAMAISLAPQSFGELIDPYHGKDDLDRKLIRILHPNSFIDDATRIFRAIRYEQRLGFNLESETAKILHRDIAMVKTISGDRLRHELELILKEDYPETVLRRADKLGALQQLHHCLKGNGWLGKKFSQARKISRRASPFTLYLCLLIYNLTPDENEQFLSRLNFPGRPTEAMRHTLRLKTKLDAFAQPQLKPSEIYEHLQGFVPQSIQTNAIASDSAVVKKHLHLYLAKLRTAKQLLDGEDLKRMGIPQGPQLGQMLARLHEATLNSEVRTREEAEKLVRQWQTRS